MTTGHARAIALALTTLAAIAAEGHAQGIATRPRARPEARLDYLGPNPETVHVGLGLNVPFGTYVRLQLVGAGGASRDDGRSGASARGDVIARFSFDPFRERQWGLSAGGGLSIRYDARGAAGADDWRALIAIVVDLEGPLAGSVCPALQVGLGGGARVGVILRRAERLRR